MTNKLLTSWNQQAGLIANQHNDLQKAIDQHNQTNANAFAALIALISEAVRKTDYKLLADAFPAFRGLPEHYQEKIAHTKSEEGRLKDVISITETAFGARKGNWKNQQRMLSILESLPNPFKPLTLTERKEKTEKPEKTQAEKMQGYLKSAINAIDKLIAGGMDMGKAEAWKLALNAEAGRVIHGLTSQNDIGAGEPPSANVKSA